jgi:hypothetical protein
MSFKKCGVCQSSWESRTDFIISPKIKLIGYQACLDEPNDGLFLFNHEEYDCGTTLAVEVGDFIDLYNGPLYSQAKTDTRECGGYCHHIDRLDACHAECAYAHIRALLQLLRAKNMNLIISNQLE